MFSARRAIRLLPALAFATTAFAALPSAQAATISSATSPGPLTVTVGTASPAIVGQTMWIGLAVTNTSADAIGPFAMGLQVGPGGKMTSTTTTGVHTCSKSGGNGFSCDFLGLLQPALTQNAWSLSMVPQVAGDISVTGFVHPILGSAAPSNSATLVVHAVAL